jgi:hypothetical protein
MSDSDNDDGRYVMRAEFRKGASFYDAEGITDMLAAEGYTVEHSVTNGSFTVYADE